MDKESIPDKMPYGDLLLRFTEMSRDVLHENLIGVYLHGSAAMGCFNPQKSDLDLILVTESGLSRDVKMEFMKNALRLNGEAPSKGMEWSIVKKEVCRPFLYPTPYELHFSMAHLNWFQENPDDYVARMQGTDKDLAAHFTIIRQYGITLYGQDIDQVFGAVPRQAYMDSIWSDVENAYEDIAADPVYIALNLCRVLAYLQEGLILSKKAGGEWGLRTLPEEFRPFLWAMLQSYISGETRPFLQTMPQSYISGETVPGGQTDPDIRAKYAQYMISQIQKAYKSTL